jgi:hypothetical protein
MISYLTHYCNAHIDKYPSHYDLFAVPFQQTTRNPRPALNYLNICLNSFYFNNPLQEPIPSDRRRQPPNLKGWAKMTVDALDFGRHLINSKDLAEETDVLIAHIFCHWDNLIRALTEAKSFEGYDEDQRTQDIIDICNILGKAFALRIQDGYNDLKKSGKHAVPSFSR